MYLLSVQSPLGRAESILRALSGPILLLDNSLTAILANGAFCDLLNISPEVLEGKTLKELLDASDGPHLRTLLEAVAAKGGDALHVVIACSIPPDTHKSLEVKARRMAGTGGHPEMVLVELRDVTDEIETTRRLQELNEELTRHGKKLEQVNADLEHFNRWVSHDLRTPLRFVSTVSNQLLVRHGETLHYDARASVKLILDSTEEMGLLIENLLAFVEVDRVSVKKRRVNTVRLVREALADLTVYQTGRDLEIQVDDLPACSADRALLKQVFLNLLANALAFTRPRERAEIQIGFQTDGDGTAYFVRDNGVGFEERGARAISFPQCKVAAKVGRHLQGSGVGLTLVKRIVERHGGRIWAEGNSSQGATFYIQLETVSHAEDRRA